MKPSDVTKQLAECEERIRKLEECYKLAEKYIVRLEGAVYRIKTKLKVKKK